MNDQYPANEVSVTMQVNTDYVVEAINKLREMINDDDTGGGDFTNKSELNKLINVIEEELSIVEVDLA